MNTVRIILPLPPRVVSPNGRAHWAAKARAVKAMRYRAAAEVLAARGKDRAVWPAATVQVTYYHRDRRRRDGDNALASCKAFIDGIADAGLVADDVALTYPPVRFKVDKARPRVELEISPPKSS